jgi:hypothetical protein
VLVTKWGCCSPPCATKSIGPTSRPDGALFSNTAYARAAAHDSKVHSDVLWCSAKSQCFVMARAFFEGAGYLKATCTCNQTPLAVCVSTHMVCTIANIERGHGIGIGVETASAGHASMQGAGHAPMQGAGHAPMQEGCEWQLLLMVAPRADASCLDWVVIWCHLVLCNCSSCTAEFCMPQATNSRR